MGKHADTPHMVEPTVDYTTLIPTQHRPQDATTHLRLMSSHALREWLDDMRKQVRL